MTSLTAYYLCAGINGHMWQLHHCRFIHLKYMKYHTALQIINVQHLFHGLYQFPIILLSNYNFRMLYISIISRQMAASLMLTYVTLAMN